MSTNEESPPSAVLLLRPFDLGRVMRSRRVESEMTQANLASAVGVSAKWISEVENGKMTVEVGKIMEVLDHLGYALAIAPHKEPSFDLAAHIESFAQPQ